MSTTLVVTFPWGLYHATPWAKNVNEGVVEWPPSPWRVLRTLFATWKTRAPQLDDATVHGLLDDLAGLPSYTIPPFTEAHTRHYMPDKDHKLGLKGQTDKVIDAFVVTGRDAQLAITWDVDLTTEQRQALEELAELVPYLGRAESVCTMRLASPDETFDGRLCQPLEESVGVDRPTRLLAPNRPLDIGTLTTRTTEVRKGGRLDPPGTTWADYTAVVADVPVTPTRRSPAPVATAVRWALATNAPPSLHAAVATADALRGAAMGRYGALFDGGTSVVLAGKDADGAAQRGGHRHAHYLAIDTDDDCLLDTVVLWAPDGLGPDDLRAVGQIRDLRGHSFVRDLRPCQLGLEAFGPIDLVAPELTGPATVWTSHTPFAPTRHGRKSTDWLEYLRCEVERELGYRGFPAPASIELQSGNWLDFRRRRLKERLEDSRRAVGLEITFSAPVQGPIALGALSHFGLGLFLPKPDTATSTLG